MINIRKPKVNPIIIIRESTAEELLNYEKRNLIKSESNNLKVVKAGNKTDK